MRMSVIEHIATWYTPCEIQSMTIASSFAAKVMVVSALVVKSIVAAVIVVMVVSNDACMRVGDGDE